MARHDVLIAGAGPTGLVLALWLTKLGVRVRIIDKSAEPGTTSRALAVQARTLELYRQLGLTQGVIDGGHKVPAVNLWAAGRRTAHLDFTDIGAGLTPYSFLEIFPQDAHEKLLVARLGELGVTVERQTELLGFAETGDHVVARLRGADGAEESFEATYLAGCDGARSVVRESIGTGFPGGTYQKIFYVADVEASGPAVNGELHVDLDEADFLAIFPLAASGRARLIGAVRAERAEAQGTLKFADVSDRALRNLKVRVDKVNWFSTYRVHHRVAAHFRKGHAFLLGDAAHIHSPVGGQGMNTGIGDAINLAWKLAWVLGGRAPARLLDSYESERIGFARKLVASTDRAFTLVTAQGKFADLMRTKIAPLLLGRITKFAFARRFLFRTVSQIMVNYRGGPLSAGKAGKVEGGDRLPWTPGEGLGNFEPLARIGWQVHVYGTAEPALHDWCRQNQVPLEVFAWREEPAAAGLVRDAFYLLRPDTYVALAGEGGAVAALERYFSEREMRPNS